MPIQDRLRSKVLYKIPTANGLLSLSRVTIDGGSIIRLHASKDALTGPGVNLDPDSLGELIEALKSIYAAYGPQHGKPGEGQGVLF